ncbi:hypothetical protein Tco_0741424 [Tanacetum coccineum]
MARSSMLIDVVEHAVQAFAVQASVINVQMVSAENNTSGPQDQAYGTSWKLSLFTSVQQSFSIQQRTSEAYRSDTSEFQRPAGNDPIKFKKLVSKSYSLAVKISYIRQDSWNVTVISPS